MSASRYPRRTIALGPPFDNGTYWEGDQMRRLPEPDWPTVSDISEALWVETNAYGVRLAVDEQVAIAQAIHSHARRIPTSDSINQAFRSIGLHAPRGLAVAIRGRLDRLHGR